MLRLGDVAAEIAIADVDVDVGGQLPILGPDRCRPPGRSNLGDFSQRHCAAGRHGDQNVVGDGLRIFPQIARIAHVDAESLAALDRRSHGLAAEGGRDDVLDVLNHDAVACQSRAVGRHFEVIATDPALGIGRRRAGHGLQDLLDLLGELVDLDQISTYHLHPDWCADSSRQHVDARLDRHGPGVGHAGKLQRLVHLRDQAVDRHTRTPFLFRFKVDDGLEHLRRGRVGGGRSASRLAVD